MAIIASLPGPNLFSNLPNTPTPKTPNSSPKIPTAIKRITGTPNTTNQSNRAENLPARRRRPSNHIREFRNFVSIARGSVRVYIQLFGDAESSACGDERACFFALCAADDAAAVDGESADEKGESMIKLFEPLGGGKEDELKAAEKRYEMLRDYELGKFSMRPREEVLGEPLTKVEIKEMLKPCLSSNKQLHPDSSTFYRVAASLGLSSSPKRLAVSVTSYGNAIFFSGDRVEGTGNPVIERLSYPLRIAEVLVSKFGGSINAFVVEAPVFNGPFAVYRDFAPFVNEYGDPTSYDATGFPASTSLVLLLSNFLYYQAEGLVAEMTRSECYDLIEQYCDHILKNLTAMDKQRYQGMP